MSLLKEHTGNYEDYFVFIHIIEWNQVSIEINKWIIIYIDKKVVLVVINRTYTVYNSRFN